MMIVYNLKLFIFVVVFIVSFRCNTKSVSRFELLFGKCAEKVDFVLAWWFPLIVTFKGALEVSFDVDIECLRL